MPSPRLYNITVPDHMLSLSELHEMAINFAEELFSRKGEVPFLWILDLGHEILWVETPWKDDVEKEACVRILKIIMRESKARAYVNMVEAYMAKAKPDDEYIMPSQRPQNERDDVLMVTSFNKAGEQLVSRYLVTVRRKGLNFLGPRDDWDIKDGYFAGFMFNLMKDSAICQGCGLTIGHKDGCTAPFVARIFTGGKV